MNRHALAVLEFPRVLDEVAGRATSELGAEHVRSLAPQTDRQWIEREHARTAAVRSLRASVAGLTWSPAELLATRQLLRSSRRSREALSDEKRPAAARAVLFSFVDRLVQDRAIEAAIDKCIADDATVKDDASPALRKLRRDLRASEGELIRLLEKQVSKLDESYRVPDMSVTMRNGRYVIPVRREGRSAVNGIVHDTSATGGTLFIEPPAAVEFGNRIREMEIEEREEVERILAELTEQIRPLRDSLEGALEALVELDSLHARAAFAVAHDCVPPLVPQMDQSHEEVEPLNQADAS